MNYTERTARSKLFRIIDILPAAARRHPAATQHATRAVPFLAKLFSHPNRFDLRRPSLALRGNNNNNNNILSNFVGTARPINFIQPPPPSTPVIVVLAIANPIVDDSRAAKTSKV